MIGALWPFVNVVSLLLRLDEREAVVGDLTEAGVSSWSALLEVLGLIVRRQAELWNNWRPWLAAFGLALPGTLLLMGFSLSVSSVCRQFVESGTGTFSLMMGYLLLLAGWAWAAGFVAGSLSRRTLWVSALLSVSPCIFCLARFRHATLPRLCLLLFLIPAVWGARQGLRLMRLNLRVAIVLASGITALMVLSWGGKGPWTLNSGLIWPAWYMVGTARRHGPRAKLNSRSALVAVIALIAVMPAVMPAAAAPMAGRVLTRELQSANFAHNKIGVGAARKMVVYLPAGYDGSLNRYPVIYYLANPSDGYRFAFEHDNAQDLFDTGIAAHLIDKFILVSVDMNTPLGCSWYVNSSATGNWEDFLVEELVLYMDTNFRTIPGRNSRGLLGDRMGGYGAIRIGMRHPEVFGSVYALHPVGTGSGIQIMYSRPNWDLLANAKSMADLKGDPFSTIFVSIFQAHLPNPGRAPLFTDLPAHKTEGRLVIDTRLTDRLRNSFLLETLIPQYAENLKTLRGFKLDWGRSDPIQDHVYSNQAFTHKLDEFGVPHEAEEYRGSWGERNWGEDGRVYTEVLPFFRRHFGVVNK